MHAIIGSKLLSSNVFQATNKAVEIYDARLPGFTLRIQPSGIRPGAQRASRSHRAPGVSSTLRRAS